MVKINYQQKMNLAGCLAHRHIMYNFLPASVSKVFPVEYEKRTRRLALLRLAEAVGE